MQTANQAAAAAAQANDPKKESQLDWRTQVFPEVLKTIVEHDAIMRSWIRFLLGIEASVILAIWALASSSRLREWPFRILVLIIGIFGSWMALQIIGVIGRVRQWNNWFINVARTMQKDGGVNIYPVNDGQQQITDSAPSAHPDNALRWTMERATSFSLWLFNSLRLAIDQNCTAHYPNATNSEDNRKKSALDALPLPDKSAIFRLLLAGNTVFLLCLWTAIALLCCTYEKTESSPLVLELTPNSVTNVIQAFGSIKQASATNNLLIQRSIENLTGGFQSSSNVFQVQITEARHDLADRTDKMLWVLSNRTEFLLQSLSSRLDTVLASRVGNIKAVPTNAAAQSQTSP